MFKNVEQSTIPDNQKDMLYSTLFRQAYGGMAGDLKMLCYYVATWFDKFKGGDVLEYVEINNIPINTISDLEPSEILINAADFHCFPQILDMVHHQFPLLSVEEIKRCIWECNSKTNYRENAPIDTQILATWSVIEPFVSNLQRTLIGGTQVPPYPLPSKGCPVLVPSSVPSKK
jgi:hypothetical protein